MQNIDNKIYLFLSDLYVDAFFRLKNMRSLQIALILSLLIHTAILFLIIPKIEKTQAIEVTVNVLQVNLSLPKPAKKKPKRTKPKLSKLEPKANTQKTEAQPNRNIYELSEAVNKAELSQEKTLQNSHASQNSTPTEAELEETPVDMISYINQKRANRAAQESDEAHQNFEIASRELEPSAERKRDDVIKNNLNSGTNGIFRVTRLGSGKANFTFRGWLNNLNASKPIYYTVEADAGEDVRLLMIKKMITLIRQRYQSDFNWKSRRLNRVVVLSARVEDDIGLEDFMMIEFFGAQYKMQSSSEYERTQ